MQQFLTRTDFARANVMCDLIHQSSQIMVDLLRTTHTGVSPFGELGSRACSTGPTPYISIQSMNLSMLVVEQRCNCECHTDVSGDPN